MDEDFLLKKIEDRRNANALRSLVINNERIDFCSNDYLGIVKNNVLKESANNTLPHGSTGSRLLSGNYKLVEDTEELIVDFHNADSGLILNSGYDANLALLASVPQKADVIIYDQLSHASIRDGIRLSFANSFSFVHNDVVDLEKKLSGASLSFQNIFVVTESVFSMDGDMAPLQQIVDLCERFHAGLIVDEAHATGVIGERGEGLVQKLDLQQKCFARIHTFGKACGCHGAIILGSKNLKTYLINFARPFIYSTALPPADVNAIASSYKLFPLMHVERLHINKLVQLFKESKLKYTLIKSETPIQGVVVPGNAEVKSIAALLQENNFDVRPILYPTVPKGGERLRIVLHSFNSIQEVKYLIELLA